MLLVPHPYPLGPFYQFGVPIPHLLPVMLLTGHTHVIRACPSCLIEIASLEDTYLEVIPYSDPRDICG